MPSKLSMPILRHTQCDQMVRLFFNICPLAAMKINPIIYQFLKVGSTFCQIRNKLSKFCQSLVKMPGMAIFQQQPENKFNKNLTFPSYFYDLKIWRREMYLARFNWHTSNSFPISVWAAEDNFFPKLPHHQIKECFVIEMLSKASVKICNFYELGLYFGKSVSVTPSQWQKSFATFGLGSSSQILVPNWKKYPCQFHWQWLWQWRLG